MARPTMNAYPACCDMDDAENSCPAHRTCAPRPDCGWTCRARWRAWSLIPALPRFYARYPEIQLTLGVSDRIIDIIGENNRLRSPWRRITDQSLGHGNVRGPQLGIYAHARLTCKRFGQPRIRVSWGWPAQYGRLSVVAYRKALALTPCSAAKRSSRSKAPVD